MNAYVASVIDYVKQTHANEPEFVQTVEEVLSSLSRSWMHIRNMRRSTC